MELSSCRIAKPLCPQLLYLRVINYFSKEVRLPHHKIMISLAQQLIWNIRGHWRRHTQLEICWRMRTSYFSQLHRHLEWILRQHSLSKSLNQRQWKWHVLLHSCNKLAMKLSSFYKTILVMTTKIKSLHQCYRQHFWIKVYRYSMQYVINKEDFNSEHQF
jgi:hypothetical protein